MNNLTFKTGESIKFKEKSFTQLVGGFLNDNPIITVKQISKLLNSKDKVVNQTINRNLQYFENDIHIIDIKNSVTESDSLYNILLSQGYSKQSISNSKNIYILSEAGFLLYLKFAEGDKSVEIYKDFIEDYFKTKAENKIFKATLKEQIDNMYEQYDLLYGKAIRTGDRELFAESSKINNKIIELEKQLSEELTIAKYKVYEEKYKQFMDAEGCFTFEDTSKILSTKADSENLQIKVNKMSLPKMLRDKGILSKAKSGKSYKNQPNSNYEKYFNTTPKDIEVTNKKGETYTMQKTQTRVNKQGLDFIYDLLTENKSV